MTIIDISSGKRHQGFVKLSVVTDKTMPTLRWQACGPDGDTRLAASYYLTINGGGLVNPFGTVEKRENGWTLWGGNLTGKQRDYLQETLSPYFDEAFSEASTAFAGELAANMKYVQSEADDLAAAAQKKARELELLTTAQAKIAAGETLPQISAVEKYGEAGHMKSGQHNFDRGAPWGTVIFFGGRPIAALQGKLSGHYGFRATIEGQLAFEWVKSHERDWNSGQITLWEGK